MRYISVCAGIEAATVAWHHLGWQPVAFSEIEPFPSAVLAHHYPNVPNLGDMTRFEEWPVELLADADILVGGSPCQAFSVAGKRESLADARGNLTLVYTKLLEAIDEQRSRAGRPPAICIWENVPGVLSTKDNAFGCFLAGLVGEEVPLQAPRGKWKDAGVVVGPERLAAWRILDAQFFGVAQRRRRVFLVSVSLRHPRAWACAAALLPLTESVRRDSPPRREARQDTSGSTGDGVARCITTGEMKRQDWETCNMVAHSLRGEGFDASEGWCRFAATLRQRLPATTANSPTAATPAKARC
jgi:DNA (cytosine-5)-methyltransferase 1